MFSPWIDLDYERPFPRRTQERAMVNRRARSPSPDTRSMTRTGQGVRFGGPTILPLLDGPALPVSLSPRPRATGLQHPEVTMSFRSGLIIMGLPLALASTSPPLLHAQGGTGT